MVRCKARQDFGPSRYFLGTDHAIAVAIILRCIASRVRHPHISLDGVLCWKRRVPKGRGVAEHPAGAVKYDNSLTVEFTLELFLEAIEFNSRIWWILVDLALTLE